MVVAVLEIHMDRKAEVAINPTDGPTNKADCLNWVYQGVIAYERKHNRHFDFFVMHILQTLHLLIIILLEKISILPEKYLLTKPIMKYLI